MLGARRRSEHEPLHVGRHDRLEGLDRRLIQDRRPVRFRRPAACQIAVLFARVEMKITDLPSEVHSGRRLTPSVVRRCERVVRDVVDIDVGGIRAEQRDRDVFAIGREARRRVLGRLANERRGRGAARAHHDGLELCSPAQIRERAGCGQRRFRPRGELVEQEPFVELDGFANRLARGHVEAQRHQAAGGRHIHELVAQNAERHGDELFVVVDLSRGDGENGEPPRRR